MFSAHPTKGWKWCQYWGRLNLIGKILGCSATNKLVDTCWSFPVQNRKTHPSQAQILPDDPSLNNTGSIGVTMLKTMLKVSKRWLSDKVVSVRYVGTASFNREENKHHKTPKSWEDTPNSTNWYLSATNKSILGQHSHSHLLEPDTLVSPVLRGKRQCTSAPPDNSGERSRHWTLNSSLKSWSGCIIFPCNRRLLFQVFATQPLITSKLSHHQSKARRTKITWHLYQCHHSHLNWDRPSAFGNTLSEHPKA